MIVTPKILTVHLAGRGRYDATCDGETIVRSVHEPLFASARALLANGVDPDVTLTMRHVGSQTNCLSGKVGRSLGWMSRSPAADLGSSISETTRWRRRKLPATRRLCARGGAPLQG